LPLKLLTRPLWQQDKVVDSHPFQKQVFYDESRHKIVIAGRQFGKTTLISEECLKVAKRIPNANCWIVSTSKGKATTTYWNYLCNRVSYLKWISNPDRQFRRSEKTIILNNGSSITLKSYENKSSLIGEPLDFCGLDEFNSRYVDDIDEIWEVQLSPVCAVRKGRFFIIGTPNGYDRLYELYMTGQPDSPTYNPECKSWLFMSKNNPFIPPEEIANAKRTLSPQAFRQEWEASFESSSNSTYNEFNRFIHIKELEIDRSLPLRLSFDFNTKPMTTTVCQIRDGNPEQNEQEKVVLALKSINTMQSSTQKQCIEIKHWLNSIKWDGEIHIYGDAAGHQRKTNNDTLSSDWDIVELNFPKPQYIYHLLDSNPAVRERTNAVNMKLRNAEEKIGAYINKNDCFPLIQDLEKVVNGDDGKPDKNLERNGLVHNSDNFGYLIYREFGMKKSLPFVFGVDFSSQATTI
jgi:hypothetical protein